MTYWDTIAVGETRTLGSHPFTAREIRRFAARYDPQPFHLDEEAARASVLGGLCASGWHTACVFMRLNVEAIEARSALWTAAGNPAPAIGPSPGFTAMKWPLPVFAGDTVTYRQTITAKRLSASRPGWGIVESAENGTNQDGRVVFAFQGAAFVGIA